MSIFCHTMAGTECDVGYGGGHTWCVIITAFVVTV